MNVSRFNYQHFLNHQPSLITGLPACDTVTYILSVFKSKEKKNEHTLQSWLFSHLSCCEIPRVLFPSPTVSGSVRRLFTLSAWEGSSGFPEKTGNCCFASDLLNSHRSSVTATAYSHGEAGRPDRGGLWRPSNETGLQWAKWVDQASAPPIYTL